MANSINVHVYRFERDSTGTNNVVTAFFNKTQPVNLIQDVVPVNSAGGQDISGIGYLYAKITLRQPGTNQEYYVMNSVQDIQNKMNA